MDELTRIRFQWDEFYEIIFYEATGTWSAQWKEDPETCPIVALDFVSLYDMIRNDYTARRSSGGGFYAGLSERMST